MKLWVKILLGAVAGFGGGFAAGFFTHKKMNDIQFEEVTEEQMAEIEQKVAAAQAKAAEEAKTAPAVVEGTKIETEKLPEDPDKLKNALQGKTPYMDADKEQKLAYEKLWKATAEYSNKENADQLPTERERTDTDGDEEAFDEDFISQIEQEAEKGNDFVEPPHPISFAEFSNERPEYDKITIHWYEPDDVWVDENEEIIPDSDSYIGMKVEGLFASNTTNGDPDIRFVRNMKYGSDYEVIRHHRSYWDTVGGVE